MSKKINLPKIIHDPNKMNLETVRQKNKKKKIVFIPTMGALHEGHLSLIKKGKKIKGLTIVSIFVNPIQFNDINDLKKYPNTLKKDIENLRQLKVDYLFLPNVEKIFPNNFETTVSINNLQKFLCGKNRPGHFNGVSTIVLKLFNIISPNVAIFGQKDFQQLTIIKKMVEDLNMNIKILEGPIIRESNGLAMSSRNKLLSPKNFHKASNIYKGLKYIKDEYKKGGKSSKKLIKKLEKYYIQSEIRNIDYIEIFDPLTLNSIKYVKKGAIIAIAVKIGAVRLIDNLKF